MREDILQALVGKFEYRICGGGCHPIKKGCGYKGLGVSWQGFEQTVAAVGVEFSEDVIQ